jgi:uncharacterized membrane protein
MTNVIAIARWAHIFAGMLALAVFWLPLVAKKGGRLHRVVGWIYVASMALVAPSGVLLCIAWLTDARPANDAFAAFLMYVAINAAASAWMGVRALRMKRRNGPNRNLADLALPILLTLGGPALAAVGIANHTPLFVLFAALGTVQGIMNLRFWLRPPATRVDHLLQHIGGMGTSCITTVTAFLVVNAPRLGTSGLNPLIWILPGALGGVAIALVQRSYRRPTPDARREGATAE